MRRWKRLQASRKRASSGGLCLRISTAHNAGVALIATTSEMPTASRKANESGRKNVPWMPVSMKIGSNATATAAVA